jgi:hypothetical protein
MMGCTSFKSFAALSPTSFLSILLMVPNIVRLNIVFPF